MYHRASINLHILHFFFLKVLNNTFHYLLFKCWILIDFQTFLFQICCILPLIKWFFLPYNHIVLFSILINLSNLLFSFVDLKFCSLFLWSLDLNHIHLNCLMNEFADLKIYQILLLFKGVYCFPLKLFELISHKLLFHLCNYWYYLTKLLSYFLFLKHDHLKLLVNLWGFKLFDSILRLWKYSRHLIHFLKYVFLTIFKELKLFVLIQ